MKICHNSQQCVFWMGNAFDSVAAVSVPFVIFFMEILYYNIIINYVFVNQIHSSELLQNI